jgi:hypothetical protein
VPPNIAWHKRGTNYIHVGVGITLQEKPGQLPSISYNHDYKKFWAMILMRIREFFLWWIFTFKGSSHFIAGIVVSMEDTIKAMDKEHMSLPGGLAGLYEEYVYKTHN